MTNRMLKRRLRTIPMTFIAVQLSLILLPITLILGGVIDLIRGGKSSVMRTFAFLTFLLISETIGLLVALVLWLGYACSMFQATDWFRKANYSLQRAWAIALWKFALFTYGIDVEIEGEAAPGPSLFLVRHVSTFDTLLPFIVTQNRTFRYVLKSELLSDPCLDVVGHRVPNIFVKRGQSDTEKQVERVIGLTEGMTPQDAVVIFPEGTRFTETKRDRIREKAIASDDALFEQAATELSHTLPPTRAGAVALLQVGCFENITIIAHVGAEKAVSIGNLFSGALRDIVFKVKVWNYVHEPKEDLATRQWLVERWKVIDTFIGDHRALQ